MCFAVLENPVLFSSSPASPAAVSLAPRGSEAPSPGKGGREEPSGITLTLQTNSQAGMKGFGQGKTGREVSVTLSPPVTQPSGAALVKGYLLQFWLVPSGQKKESR